WHRRRVEALRNVVAGVELGHGEIIAPELIASDLDHGRQLRRRDEHGRQRARCIAARGDPDLPRGVDRATAPVVILPATSSAPVTVTRAPPTGASSRSTRTPA